MIVRMQGSDTMMVRQYFVGSKWGYVNDAEWWEAVAEWTCGGDSCVLPLWLSVVMIRVQIAAELVVMKVKMPLGVP